MSATHTKGPWFIFGNGHCVGGPSGIDPDHATAGVAMCGMARRDLEECEANARLIAAAPAFALVWSALPPKVRSGVLDYLDGEGKEWVRESIKLAMGET